MWSMDYREVGFIRKLLQELGGSGSWKWFINVVLSLVLFIIFRDIIQNRFKGR